MYINIIGAIPSFNLQDHILQNVGRRVALRRGLKPSKHRHLLRYVLTICFKFIFSHIDERLLAMVYTTFCSQIYMYVCSGQIAQVQSIRLQIHGSLVRASPLVRNARAVNDS